MTLTHRPHDDGQGGDDEEYVERSSSFIPFVAAAVIAGAVLIFGFPSAPKKDPRDTNTAGRLVRTVEQSNTPPRQP
jgi:hypothetical protein